ncbi:hypothetical protein IAR55_003242 [Kwoniella newhampshirensis]|uniref:Alpha/beta hydrolase fold-3 domain-containing protein n=1 Tax=Kwoniella newhampshirensis TaxID=1651941 RepID=A0AAW0YWL8_9TREE
MPQTQASTSSSSYSPWMLSLRAKALRTAASVAIGLQHYAAPAAPSPTTTEWIDATLGDRQGKNLIRLDIYHPDKPNGGKAIEGKGRPGMIVFHGGGFVIGNGTDDARWATAANDQLGAVVIAVSYRLAPEIPFPIPVEDCASSILHVSSNASRYGIDPSQLLIAGFSAGGNLAFASYHLLHFASNWKYSLPAPPPPIRGIVGFYPLLDYTRTREDKRETSIKPEFALPASLTHLFDTSYLPPGTDLRDPRVSPGIAPDEMIDRLPPVHLVLCEYDMLCSEGLDFKGRLEKREKVVSCGVVEGEKHGWDRPPPLTPKPTVAVEYAEALSEVKKWLQAGS